MKTASKVLLIAVLGVATAFQARANLEYDWTGGTAGYSGTIILDSNSNSAGSISDIVSGQITTPQGTYVFDSGMVFSTPEPFAWNPSQITDMWIDWYQPTLDPAWAGFGENYGGGGLNFVGSGTDRYNDSTWVVDFAGSWTAASSIPDGGAVIALLSGALVALAALRRRISK